CWRTVPCAGAGLNRPRPGRVRGLLLADHERLAVAGAVCVEPARAALARRGARHRADAGVPALVEGGGAGHLDGRAPGAVDLADDIRLGGKGSLCVAPARAAVAR